jgi:hypothetical protein
LPDLLKSTNQGPCELVVGEKLVRAPVEVDLSSQHRVGPVGYEETCLDPLLDDENRTALLSDPRHLTLEELGGEARSERGGRLVEDE